MKYFRVSNGSISLSITFIAKSRFFENEQNTANALHKNYRGPRSSRIVNVLRNTTLKGRVL